MRVTMTAWHEREPCTWCEREKECVTVEFEDGFLVSLPLCWRCLQKAVKVRNRTEAVGQRGDGRPARVAAQTPEPAAGP